MLRESGMVTGSNPGSNVAEVEFDLKVWWLERVLTLANHRTVTRETWFELEVSCSKPSCHLQSCYLLSTGPGLEPGVLTATISGVAISKKPRCFQMSNYEIAFYDIAVFYEIAFYEIAFYEIAVLYEIAF